jgi:hypothetical protein
MMTVMKMNVTNLRGEGHPELPKLLVSYVVTAILLSVVSLLFFSSKTTLNLLIGFGSAALVMVGSMAAYARMIQAKLAHNIEVVPQTQTSYDNPYGLFDDEEEENALDQAKDLRELIKQEKENLKKQKRGVWESVKDVKASLSLYRVGSYIVLIVGFLFLQKQGMLELIPYLLSLALPPLLMVGVLLRTKT